jgi:hypothetical protein
MSHVNSAASIAVGLLAGMAAMASPARASTVNIGLTISYFATIPGNPIAPSPPQITPSNFIGTQLTGSPKFFSGDTLIPGNPIFGPLSVGQTFVGTFEPPDPCFGATSCSIGFSFAGSAGNYPASGFPITTDFPSTSPDPALVWSIGTLDFSAPSPPTIRVSGMIVGFDDPEVIGEWAVTLNVETTPLPAALPLFASGLGALGLLGWRRKRKAAAAA